MPPKIKPSVARINPDSGGLCRGEKNARHAMHDSRTSMWPIQKKKPVIRCAHKGHSFFILLLKASFQRNKKTKPSRLRGRAFSFVGVRRLELPTPTSRTWYASQLRYTPNFVLPKLNFFING